MHVLANDFIFINTISSDDNKTKKKKNNMKNVSFDIQHYSYILTHVNSAHKHVSLNLTRQDNNLKLHHLKKYTHQHCVHTLKYLYTQILPSHPLKIRSANPEPKSVRELSNPPSPIHILASHVC